MTDWILTALFAAAGALFRFGVYTKRVKPTQEFYNANIEPVISDDQAATRIELYKAEYEHCIERYENLYKSVWTQCNYFIIASGAIITFGKDKFGSEVVAILAVSPMLFWFWGTFEPLNRYADDAAARAREIEVLINNIVFGNDLKFHSRVLSRVVDRGLNHFKLFVSDRRDGINEMGSIVFYGSRVLGLLSFVYFVSAVVIFRARRPQSFGGIPDLIPAKLQSIADISIHWHTALTALIVAVMSVPLAVFGEKIKRPLGVRPVVRMVFVLCHMVAISALALYVGKITHDVPTGPLTDPAKSFRYTPVPVGS